LIEEESIYYVALWSLTHWLTDWFTDSPI